MKKILVLITCGLFVNISYAEFWTVNYIQGVNVSSSGTTYISLATDHKPYSPNPSTLVWEPCRNNNLIFSKDEKNIAIPPKTIDRMLAATLVAYSKKSRLRLLFERDSENNCYLKQVYML